jgi:hypothetical protein
MRCENVKKPLCSSLLAEQLVPSQFVTNEVFDIVLALIFKFMVLSSNVDFSYM